MYFVVALLFGTLCVCASALQGDPETEIWENLLYHDVAPSTYATLVTLDIDDPKDYRSNYNWTRRSKYPMDHKRTDHVPSYYYDERQTMTDWTAIMLGRAGNMMYRLALQFIRKYIPMRYLYMDNLQYEVGYVAYQIFHRYQMMLEVYDVAYRKFYLRPQYHVAPIKYMVYLYIRMFKLSFHVVHLCNMAHEMQKKFVGHDSIFTHTEPPPMNKKKKKELQKQKALQAAEVESVFNEIEIVNVRMKALAKAKKRAMKKKHREMMAGRIISASTPRTARPTQMVHGSTTRPNFYGWSIEDWWL